MALVKAQIRAYLTTYPDTDILYLLSRSFPSGANKPNWLGRSSTARTGIAKSTSLEKLTAAARDRKLIASGERGVQSCGGT